MSEFPLSGSGRNPYHLSVGGVIRDGARIALIRKPDGAVGLPTETMLASESLIACARRGAREELAAEVAVLRFLGGRLGHFARPDGAIIEKTVVYVESRVVGRHPARQPEADEIDDEILWLTPGEAVALLAERGNPEAAIVRRAERAPAAG